MGYLTIISETGFPHSACLFDYNGRKEWCGFKPKLPKTPLGPGYVDTTDRTSYIKNSVTFSVPDSVLAKVIIQIKELYKYSNYVVGIGPDCVNLSVDVARLCGLKTPSRPNLFPDNLVINLKTLNPGWINNYF